MEECTTYCALSTFLLNKLNKYIAQLSEVRVASSLLEAHRLGSQLSLPL